MPCLYKLDYEFRKSSPLTSDYSPTCYVIMTTVFALIDAVGLLRLLTVSLTSFSNCLKHL